jgi:hypothetical protein
MDGIDYSTGFSRQRRLSRGPGTLVSFLNAQGDRATLNDAVRPNKVRQAPHYQPFTTGQVTLRWWQPTLIGRTTRAPLRRHDHGGRPPRRFTSLQGASSPCGIGHV